MYLSIVTLPLSLERLPATKHCIPDLGCAVLHHIPVHAQVAKSLAMRGKVTLLQRRVQLDPSIDWKGPIRIGHPT